MGDEIVFRRDGETAFTVPQKRAVLRDCRISLAARGLFQFLWDLPGNWCIRATSLSNITQTKPCRLRTLFKELKEVGALSLKPIKLTAEQAAALSKDTGKQFRAGQVAGSFWQIHHPDAWAIEAPLAVKKTSEAPPEANPTEMQKNRNSVNASLGNAESGNCRDSELPSLGKSYPKVLQPYGSPIIKTTTPLVDKPCRQQYVMCGGANSFLEAAGNPESLMHKRATLEKYLGKATKEQISWAGFAWRDTVQDGKAEDPERLAVALCKLAKQGRLTRPKSVAELETSLDIAAQSDGWERLKSLAGRKYLTTDGLAHVNPGGTISLPHGTISGSAVLQALAHIESGVWPPA